jgi:hypothetical protein
MLQGQRLGHACADLAAWYALCLVLSIVFATGSCVPLGEACSMQCPDVGTHVMIDAAIQYIWELVR